MIKKIVLIIFCFINLLSCNETKYDVPIIESTQIFKINKEYYYVLIYLNGCMACRDVKQIINKANYEIKSEFYYVDLENNKNLLYSQLVSNVNCCSYEEIKIKKTPTLFVIRSKIIIEEYIGSYTVIPFLYSLI